MSVLVGKFQLKSGHMRQASKILLMLILAGLLSACGPLTTFVLVGDVVNAAGNTYMDQRDAQRTQQDEIDDAYEEILQAKAAEGDPESQYQLGMFYVAKRNSEAQRWICQAAHSGHAKAQLQMGHWYSEDRLQSDLWPFIPIRPDDNQAYVWYSLAEKGGDEDAALFRMVLRDNRMTTAKVASARQVLSHWQATGCG
jgi:TPR repeat protein